MAHNSTRRFEQLTGALLLLVGLAFLLLFAFLKGSGQLNNDLKISAFMIAIAAILIWTGYRFLQVRPLSTIMEQANTAVPVLMSLRIPAEILATIGCLSMFCHAVYILIGHSWPSEPVLTVMLVGPVVIGQIVLRTLSPDALQSGVLRPELINRFSGLAGTLAAMLLRVGWLGYIAIIFAWPEVNTRIPATGSRMVQVLAAVLVSALYVSQALMLHCGERRVDKTLRRS
jgi:hypothetical protein